MSWPSAGSMAERRVPLDGGATSTTSSRRPLDDKGVAGPPQERVVTAGSLRGGGTESSSTAASHLGQEDAQLLAGERVQAVDGRVVGVHRALPCNSACRKASR